MSKGKGSKENQAFEALRQLMAQPGRVGEIWDDLLTLTGDEPIEPPYDDRAAAIVYGAMVEQSLEEAISTHFPDNIGALRVFSYENEGALPTFASKITLGRALGIYDDTLHGDLKWISRIRNAFAHARIKIEFTTPAVSDACGLLFPIRVRAGDHEVAPLTPRQRYALNAITASTYLTTPNPTGQPLRHHGSVHYRGMYGRPPKPSPDRP